MKRPRAPSPQIQCWSVSSSCFGLSGPIASQELISQVGIWFCAQHCNWGEGVLNVQAFHWSTNTFIMILGRLICTCEISSDNRPKTISKSRVILYSIPHRMPSTLRRQGSGLGRLSERLSEVAVCKKSRAPISFCIPSKQNEKLAHVPSGNSGESVIKKNTL